MTEKQITAVMEAHGRGDMKEALRLIKAEVDRGDEQAKLVYAQLVEVGRTLPTKSDTIDVSDITHWLCISPPSAFEEWQRTKRGPVEIALDAVHGKMIWESQIGTAPDPKDVSVASFKSEGGPDIAAIGLEEIEPPLASLRLGRNSGHAFFLRSVLIEDPPGKVARFVFGVAYRAPKFSITNGGAPALFLNPKKAKKHFWQFWKSEQ
jgi:hypothetical protein